MFKSFPPSECITGRATSPPCVWKGRLTVGSKEARQVGSKEARQVSIVNATTII